MQDVHYFRDQNTSTTCNEVCNPTWPTKMQIHAYEDCQIENVFVYTQNCSILYQIFCTIIICFLVFGIFSFYFHDLVRL